MFINQVLSQKPRISFAIKIRPQASETLPTSRSIFNGADDSDDDCDDDDDDYDEDDDENDDDDSEADGSNDGGNVSNEPYIKIQFDLPASYPDEKPSLTVLNCYGPSQREIETLMEKIDEIVEESLGDVMIFTIVSYITEWLLTRSDKQEEDLRELEEEQAKQATKKKELEQKTFDGTPVTAQNFLAWKAKFDAERLKIRLAQEADTLSEIGAKKMTGRQMFELDATLIESDLNFVEDLDQEHLEALLQNIDE